VVETRLASSRLAAEQLGVHPSTITRWRRLESHSEPTWVISRNGHRYPGRRVDTTERDARIRRMRAQGAIMRVIAQEVGCGIGTVHRVLSDSLSP
jgi:transposase